MMNEAQVEHMRAAIRQGTEGVQRGLGGPFGAVIVLDGQIVGRGENRVTSDIDPTAHAEIIAIRNACQTLGRFHLTGCELYTTCAPCPMCLAAIYWAKIERYFFGCTAADAAAIDFADEYIRQELCMPEEGRTMPALRLLRDECLAVFHAWTAKSDRVLY